MGPTNLDIAYTYYATNTIKTNNQLTGAGFSKRRPVYVLPI